MQKTLFVCTANICRSPMAEALWNAAGGSATSAGVQARNGWDMHPLADEELTRRGVDHDGFASRMATARLLRDADLILCMEAEHRARLAGVEPTAATKSFTLTEYAALVAEHPGRTPKELHRLRRGLKPTPDIADPVNGTSADFRRCASELEALIHRIMN
ncbi:low molecular weight phosphatase family protein [uncultured Corynebacterium sp.]|uniref:arsenate reductase/protein-tyrosine-phosphatase family protein n=1 Tax=uncultured Corynebacterium sp. TaxID=159447 RepID=UPI0025F3939D|nr:low molecular weight phosphatase family protein [uncultured Corynebacterium sp.]